MKYGDRVPVDRNWYVQFCLFKQMHSGKSSRTSTPLMSVADLLSKTVLEGENSRFRLNIQKHR
jgi:hypothetical protein